MKALDPSRTGSGSGTSRRFFLRNVRLAILATLVPLLLVSVGHAPTISAEPIQAKAINGSQNPIETAPPTATRQLLKNPGFSGLEPWKYFRGASFDASVSASPNSGSARLPSKDSTIISAPVAVKAGILYFVSAQVRQDTWPRGNVTISIQQVTSSGEWIANLPGETGIAPYVNGEFAKSGLYFMVGEKTQFVVVSFIRFNEQASEDPMWIDDAFLEQSPTTEVIRSLKTPFEGSQTRIDPLGNWQVRAADGTWQDWFPLCAALNQSRLTASRLKSVAANGINCDIWNGESVDALQNAKAAGLRSFYQLAQYTNDASWAPGQVDLLAKKYREVQNSPAADYLAGFYLDNENSTNDVVRTKLVTDTVKAIDVEGGKRRRPILQLQGSYGSLGLWTDANGTPFTDAVGTYTPYVNSGGAGSGIGGQTLLESQPGQTQPSAYCQINDGIGANFRSALFSCIAQGSRALSYWGDGPIDLRFPSAFLEDQLWWPGLPSIVRDLKQMGPLLRQTTQTTWSAAVSGDNQLVPVTTGKRNLGGIGHLILSNVSDQPQTRSVTLAGLPYKATEVRDFFTNATLAKIGADGRFDLVVPPAGVLTGSMVVRLVPTGWVPPTTTTTTTTTTTIKAVPRSTTTRARPAGSPTTKVKPRTNPATTTTKSVPSSPVAESTLTKPSGRSQVALRIPTTLALTSVKASSIKDVDPEPLCRSGTRYQAESARIPIGSVPELLNKQAREWKQAGAPSALNWITSATGKVQYRVRYLRFGTESAKRTMFAVAANGQTVSKQFTLTPTDGRWSTASVELAVASPGPVEISASFDVLTDTGDIDFIDSIDVCPLQ